MSLNKSIFITGGTSGIGAQMAKDYLKKGYRVGVCGRNKETFFKNLKNEKISFYQVDVTNLESIKSAIEDFSKYGLDIVIASAGRGYKNKTAIPNFNDCRDIININLIGVINTFEAAINFYTSKKQHGQLVTFSSLAAFNGMPGAPAYSASKAALIKYCESLSIGLNNIDVTCICPGFIDTPMTKVNKHAMPFLTDVEAASSKFINAIENKKNIYIYPKLFGYYALLIGMLPRFMFRKLITKTNLDYTKS